MSASGKSMPATKTFLYHSRSSTRYLSLPMRFFLPGSGCHSFRIHSSNFSRETDIYIYISKNLLSDFCYGTQVIVTQSVSIYCLRNNKEHISQVHRDSGNQSIIFPAASLHSHSSEAKNSKCLMIFYIHSVSLNLPLKN